MSSALHLPQYWALTLSNSMDDLSFNLLLVIVF